MAKTLRIHFLIPAERAAAAHMVSGEINNPAMMDLTGGVPFGHQGQGYVCACDPKIVMDAYDRGTGEPWAIGCIACSKTEIWKQSIKDNPHPRNVLPPTVAEFVEGCCG